MVEGVIASKVEHFHCDIVLLEPFLVIATTNIACQRSRALIASIKTQTTAIIIEVEFIILVDTFPFGWIDSQTDSYSTLDAGYGEGGLMTGLQVCLTVDIVHRSFCVKGIACLVKPYLQRQFSFWACDIGRVVRGAKVSGSEHTVNLCTPYLVARLSM